MIKILTIGNSFSDNAVKFLEDMSECDKNLKILIGKANIGGCSLEKHWNLKKQCDLLPDVKPYNYQKSGSDSIPSNLHDIIIDEDWDYITLQQLSNLSYKVETYYPYIENLYNYIMELAPQTNIVLHQTWTYRIDAKFYKENNLTQKMMFNMLKSAYDNAADRLDCPIIPCGYAFQKAREKLNYIPDSDYNFDNPPILKLPKQKDSLIWGYFWKTGNTASGKPELHLDYRHGNEKGCYLANAIWYEMFTGKSIFENDFSPKEISKDMLMMLKEIAHKSVIEYGGRLV